MKEIVNKERNILLTAYFFNISVNLYLFKLMVNQPKGYERSDCSFYERNENIEDICTKNAPTPVNYLPQAEYVRVENFFLYS